MPLENETSKAKFYLLSATVAPQIEDFLQIERTLKMRNASYVCMINPLKNYPWKETKWRKKHG